MIWLFYVWLACLCFNLGIWYHYFTWISKKGWDELYDRRAGELLIMFLLLVILTPFGSILTAGISIDEWLAKNDYKPLAFLKKKKD